MVKIRRYSFLLPLATATILITGCEDGIRFPWSKDKPHEAEVTTDTTEAESDTVAAEQASDTLDVMAAGDSSDYTQEQTSQWSQNNTVEGTRQWRVVVSSMPSQELADRFISRYNLSNARVVYVERLDTYRVVYESFSELSDAQVEFKLIRSDFPDAWLVYF